MNELLTRLHHDLSELLEVGRIADLLRWDRLRVVYRLLDVMIIRLLLRVQVLAIAIDIGERLIVARWLAGSWRMASSST